VSPGKPVRRNSQVGDDGSHSVPATDFKTSRVGSPERKSIYQDPNVIADKPKATRRNSQAGAAAAAILHTIFGVGHANLAPTQVRLPYS
jgi:hypothetical protein